MKFTKQVFLFLTVLYCTHMSTVFAQTSTNCNAPTVWNTATTYDVAGYYVTSGGQTYVSKWWTQGNSPAQNFGDGLPWDKVMTCPTGTAPVITVTGSLSAFATAANTSSAAQALTFSVANISGTVSVVVNAQGNFRVNSASAGTFGSMTTLTLAPVQGSTTVSSTVYITYNPSAGGSEGGSITFNLSGATLPPPVAVTGTATIDCSNVPFWSQFVNYSANDVVVEDHKVYSALWYTAASANNPANNINNNGNGKAWSLVGGCVANTDKGLITWNVTGNNGIKNTDFLGTTNINDLVLKANNIEGVRVSPAGTNTNANVSMGKNGNVFIGATGTSAIAPSYYKFEVNGLTALSGMNNGTAAYNQNNILTLYSGNSMIAGAKHYMGFSHGLFGTNQEYGILNVTEASGNNYKGKHLLIQNTAEGNVGIGVFTTAPTSKLSVNGDTRISGKLAVTEVFVTGTPLTAAFPDYVFNKDYKLMSLDSLHSFIDANKHLPEVPSVKEVQQNGGISMGEMNNILLKKIEELTLYLLEQDKKMKAYEARLQTVENHK